MKPWHIVICVDTWELVGLKDTCVCILYMLKKYRNGTETALIQSFLPTPISLWDLWQLEWKFYVLRHAISPNGTVFCIINAWVSGIVSVIACHISQLLFIRTGLSLHHPLPLHFNVSRVTYTALMINF